MPRGEKTVVAAGHFACVPVLVSLRGLWSGNETSRAHVYKIRKWHLKQRTAAVECCEWLLSTRVNLKLWRRWVVGKLLAMMSISFVLQSRWVLEPFFSYRCLNKSRNEEKIRKMALLLSHTFAFSCLPNGFWTLIWVLLITKRMSGCLNKLLTYLWWSLLLKYGTYCASVPSLHKESIWYTQET